VNHSAGSFVVGCFFNSSTPAFVRNGRLDFADRLGYALCAHPH
jgi:hypothetical protein